MTGSATGTPTATLMSPGRIGSLTTNNRIVFQPHSTALSRDGFPSEDQVAYHAERAAGGVGLSIFESQAVHPTGKMSRLFPHAWDPAIVPAYRRVTEAVHEHGTRIFSQLTHGGHTSLERPPPILWAPTQMPEPSTNFSTKAMETADITAVIDGFGAAARNAVDGGFDGIEVKVAHDGLLRSFASPFFNRRTDAYGGSFENRMRLSIEVLTVIRTAVGPAVPISVRLCLHEHTPWGYGLDYGLRMAEHLEASGLVDVFNVTAGSFSSYWMEIPPAAIAQGYARPLARELKRRSDLPVIAFGRLGRPDLAEEVIAGGDADFVGMARPLIADPALPAKLERGDAAGVRPCIACNEACIYQVGQEKPIRCVQNPAAGREVRWSERRVPAAVTTRHVVVVGAGPAGMKVAETAASRGHRVTVLERQADVGGQVRLAARQPHHAEIAGAITHLAIRLERLGVEVRCGVDADPDLVHGLGSDAVVFATGSEPNLPPRAGEEDAGARARMRGLQVLPPVGGLDDPSVMSADTVMAADRPPRGRVVVLDGNGHWEAAGTAEHLAASGAEVEVVTPRMLVGSDLEGATHALFTARAAELGIRLTPATYALEVAPGRVRLQGIHGGAPVWREDVDVVVAVLGRRSREDLYHDLAERCGAEDAGPEVLRIGDCVAPRLLQHALADAYELGRAL